MQGTIIQNLIHNIPNWNLNSDEWEEQFQGWGKLLSINPKEYLQGGTSKLDESRFE